MGNVFSSNKDVHETYCLKGSTFGRVTTEEETQRNPHAVLKDLNWVERNRRLEFGSIKRNLFISQLHKDVVLLSRLNVMDYSLLIGIHDNVRGNTEGIRDTHLHFVTVSIMEVTSRSVHWPGKYQTHTKSLERSLSTRNGRRESKADIVRKAIRHANPVQLNSSQLPETPSDEKKYCVFYSEEGGFKSTDDNNQTTDKLYFWASLIS